MNAPCSAPSSVSNLAPTLMPVLPVVTPDRPHLPASRAEMEALGWDHVDVVFVTGDAYVDHPAFAMGILSRVLEAVGFRVAVLSQPDWRSVLPWRQFGRPRLFFGISAGNMDSMINHYTANKKVRNDDAYSPGGRIGLRPDRATIPYCQRAREAFPGVPVIAGGVEASLRRLAHYDYWSDTVRRAIMLDAKADLVVFGMGEHQIVTIARQLASGGNVKDLRDMRGVAYALGASESPPPAAEAIVLPSFEEVKADKRRFALATKIIHQETNPLNARCLVQYHDRQAIVCNPPPLPIAEEDMDRIYGLPYTRNPHPMYKGQKIPAFEVVKDSVTLMRGCFGGCTFCSITAHQGRIIQSRSQQSVLDELHRMARDPGFTGVVSDIGGPTANMYRMKCSRPEVEKMCKRLSCVHPKICKLLDTDHGPLIELMRRAGKCRASTRCWSPPESVWTSPRSPRIPGGAGQASCRRPPEGRPRAHRFKRSATHEEAGRRRFRGIRPGVSASQQPGRQETVHRPVLHRLASGQRLERDDRPGRVPQAKRLSARPGSGLHPRALRHCHGMYYTGIDPFTGEEVYVARGLRDRKMQRALLQFFKPENYFMVREALLKAGRGDLIGNGCDCLIPAHPPRQAIEARRRQANGTAEGDHYHSIANPAKGEPVGERLAESGLPTRPEDSTSSGQEA